MKLLLNRYCAVALLSLLAFSVRTDAAPQGTDPKPPAPIAGRKFHLVKNWDFAANITTREDLYREFHTRGAGNNGTEDHLNDELEVYRDNDNQMLSNGQLHLVARVPKGSLAKGDIESGMIRSRWTGKYGYYEARMKLPPGRGMWPAFWFATPKWPPEIDVMEVVNNGGDTTRNSWHNVHGKYIGQTGASKLDSRSTYRPGFDYADGFHTFAIEWTPTSVKHYVDDVLVVERQFQWKQDNGEDGDPSPIIVNLAVGGHWPGAPTSLDEFPQSLDVAYIRVWQAD